MTIFEWLRVLLGSIYVLFLPGFALTFLLFKEKELNKIERLALSLGFSVAVVPLLTFLLSRLGLSLDAKNIFFEILAFLILVALGIAIKLKRPQFLKPKMGESNKKESVG